MFWKIVNLLVYYNIEFNITKNEVYFVYGDKYEWEIDEPGDVGETPYLWISNDEDAVPDQYCTADEYIIRIMGLRYDG